MMKNLSLIILVEILIFMAIKNMKELLKTQKEDIMKVFQKHKKKKLKTDIWLKEFVKFVMEKD